VDLKSRSDARDAIAGDEEERRLEDSPNACQLFSTPRRLKTW